MQEGVGGSQTSADVQGRGGGGWRGRVKRSPVNEARAAAVEFPIVSWSKSTVENTNH